MGHSAAGSEPGQAGALLFRRRLAELPNAARVSGCAVSGQSLWRRESLCSRPGCTPTGVVWINSTLAFGSVFFSQLLEKDSKSVTTAGL